MPGSVLRRDPEHRSYRFLYRLTITTNTTLSPQVPIANHLAGPNLWRSYFRGEAWVCYYGSIALAWRRPIWKGSALRGKGKEVSKGRTPVEGPRATEIREATLACLGGLPGGSESSVMFAHAVKRALRKNKTLRYGVPMLVSAVRKKWGRDSGRGGTTSLAGGRVRWNCNACDPERQSGLGRGWRLGRPSLLVSPRAGCGISSVPFTSLVVTWMCFWEWCQNQILTQVWMITKLPPSPAPRPPAPSYSLRILWIIGTSCVYLI